MNKMIPRYILQTIGRLNNNWTPPVGQDVWVDASNGTHPITLASLNSIADAIANRDADLFSRLQVAKLAVSNATTLKSLEAVVL